MNTIEAPAQESVIPASTDWRPVKIHLLDQQAVRPVRSAERADFLATIIVGAVEGGCCQFDFQNYQFIDGPDGLSMLDAQVEARDKERQYPEDWKQIGLSDIEAAIAKIVAPGGAEAVEMHPGYARIIAGGSALNDGTDFDAEIYDLIFQVAINGEVIFG